MSKCSRCSKIIRSKKVCSHCNNFYCSDSCLKHHINISHLNEQYNKQSININKYSINDNFFENSNTISDMNNSFNKISPFITKGTMTLGKVIYDETYSLKNFKPIIENGKDKIVGTGAYGKVFLAVNKFDNKYYAIKHMIKKDLYKALKTLKGIYTEIDIQSRINHPNIIKLLYVKERKESFDLVMEYAKYGNLYTYIKKRSYLSEEKSFKFFIQVVNAVYFLHKNDLIHRDIKPENILLFEDSAKLCDFGWCTRLDGGNRGTFCGTAEYMSPEMVNKEEYSKDIDIWSLGILLYEMVHGHSPFKPNKAKFNINDIIDNIKIQNLKFNGNISNECKELIIHLLDRDVSKRYKIEDIFNSNFVKNYENNFKDNNFTLTQRNQEYYKNKNNKNKGNESLDNNFIYTKHIISNNNNNQPLINNNKNISCANSIIEEEFQKMKCKIKNNTARNFYPHKLTKKENIKNNENTINKNNIINSNNNIQSKYGSYCKVKKTENKFDSARYISHDNILTYFKKPKGNNVKEKNLLNNNAISTPDLIKKDNNDNSNENLLLKKNNINNFKQSLTQRNIKYSSQNVKNRQILLENNNKKEDNLIKTLINDTNRLNLNLNIINNKLNYTNRSINNNKNKAKSRLNSCENYSKKIYTKSAESLLDNIDEKKIPLITDININNDDSLNNNESNNPRIIKAKIKMKQGISNNEEIKIITDNYINANTGKIKTKVKNYYRSNTNLNNINNNINKANNPQINIINNNHIYNNNIVKYSFYDQAKKNVKIKDNILSYHNSAKNKGIILLMNKDKKQGIYPIKDCKNNKDNNDDQENTVVEDLDETPKKEIDIVKIMPNVLINNFNKELNEFLKN